MSSQAGDNDHTLTAGTNSSASPPLLLLLLHLSHQLISLSAARISSGVAEVYRPAACIGNESVPTIIL